MIERSIINSNTQATKENENRGVFISNNRKRPIGITFLLILAICISALNGLRLIEAVFFWKVLVEFNASPFYIAISGFCWLLIALILAFGIWLGKPWAWIGTIFGLLIYFIWYWFDRIFMQMPHSNWVYALIFSILLLAIAAIIILNSKIQRYFKNYV